MPREAAATVTRPPSSTVANIHLISCALRAIEARDGHTAMVRGAAEMICAATAILAREAGQRAASEVLGNAGTAMRAVA